MSAIAIVLLMLLGLIFLVALMWMILSAYFGLSDRRYISPINANRRVTEPACGKCGYPTRGIGSLDCPECGADLREAGIITPALIEAVGGGTTGCILPMAWTLGLIAAGFVFDGLVTPRLPIQWMHSGWYELLFFLLAFGVWIGGLIFFSNAPKQIANKI